MTILILPYREDALRWLQRNDADQTCTTDTGLHFGDPAVEREGVVGRRMAFCHPFSEEDAGAVRSDLRWVVERLSQRLGLTAREILEKYVTIRRDGGLPADWRYPLQEGES